MRAFIAIEIPDDVKKRLSGIQDSLGRETGEPGWLKPANMHLTLKFLGSIDEVAADKVCDALKNAAKNLAPFSITTREVTLKGQRVLWIGFKESDELTELKEAIDRELDVVGIERDKKPYSPHLTLRRIKKKEQFLEIKNNLDKIDRAQEIEIPVESVDLIESELQESGAIHSTFMRIELQKI